MASINQGDDAVERLDNAVTAFEQIMTGPEGQTVAVPGHQPQPTLAERVKQNLKPSTDAAAGYATQAAASAKAADDAAKLASQISGLETVADAIGMAALPLPDVWAPLTDSLRLFTGYGREVKVGDDVIARMLTFTRSTTKTYTNRDGVLTTAAVNEPVFDQWGCSLDGAVINYITMSEGLNQIGTEAGATVVTENGYKLVQYAGTGAISKDYIAAPNIPLTFSFYVKPAASDVVIALQVRDGTSPGKTAKFRVKPTGELIVDNSNGLLSGSNITRVSASLFRVSGTTVALDGSTYRIYRGDPVIGETFGSLQLENLQYASAYIPTNGAAATRSADLLTLQNPLNIPVGAGDMTVAVEVRRNPLAPSTSFPRIFHIGSYTWLVGDSVRFAMRGGTADQGQALKNAPGTMETVVYRIKGDQITVRCGSTVATVTRTGAITGNNMVTNIGSDATGVQNLFGHVRNLRVWRRALTDDQMKAIA
ncbi:phage head spike fiber domain-containing protein [Aeromonas veronii]|uniref:phage head spike fiber domain-containing protein n=1 Tax=Aeromonas veronii TaxID=654 RepID=UPI0038B466FD